MQLIGFSYKRKLILEIKKANTQESAYTHVAKRVQFLRLTHGLHRKICNFATSRK